MQLSAATSVRAQALRMPHQRDPCRSLGLHRQRRWMARAEPEDKPDGSFESLFSKELQRRGLSVDEDDIGAGPEQIRSSSAAPPSGAAGPFANGGRGAGAAPGANPFAAGSAAGSTTRTRPRSAPPPMAPDAAQEDSQRQKSMDLVNEGLEGLFPRAKLLLQLGGSVFLGFLPFMLVFSLLFTGIYGLFGTNFVHGGREMSGPPTYIDPERLLSEPTVDPYVPYSSNPYSSPDLR